MKIEEYRSMIGLMTRKQIKDELEKMRQAQWENECIDRWAEEDRKYAQELYAKTQIARSEIEDRDMRDAQESAKREQQIEEAGGNEHE
jgi:two-component SAPR family response regulator